LGRRESQSAQVTRIQALQGTGSLCFFGACGDLGHRRRKLTLERCYPHHPPPPTELMERVGIKSIERSGIGHVNTDSAAPEISAPTLHHSEGKTKPSGSNAMCCACKRGGKNTGRLENCSITKAVTIARRRGKEAVLGDTLGEGESRSAEGGLNKPAWSS